MKTLIFLFDKKIIIDTKKYVLYGNYNKFENFNFKKTNLDIYEKNSIDDKELIIRYEECEKTFLRILKHLASELNKVHDTNYSLRFWEILLGKFLRQFIYTVFNSYNDLIYILNNQKIDEIYLLNTKKYKLSVNDTYSQSFSKIDDNWMAALNSKIIDKISFKQTKKIQETKQEYFKLPKKLNNQKNECGLLKFFSHLFNFFIKKNSIVFYSSGIPLFWEKLLEIKLNLFPSFYYIKKLDFKDYNPKIRSKINFNQFKSKNEFEKVLTSLIPEALPLYIIENFKDLEILANSSNLSKNPKVIFTSYGYAYDEVFKFYLAQNSEKKSKYIIMQHGNNYFTDIHTKYLSELQSSDLFISWGKEDVVANIHSCFNLKTIKRVKYNKNSNYLSILTNSTILSNAPYNRDHLNKINLINTANLISKFRENIKKNIRVKLHHDTLIDKNIKYYENLFKINGVQLYDEKKNIKQVLKSSRLCFFNYESTGVLENLAMNIPTVFFSTIDYSKLNKNNDNLYQLLKNSGILFDDEKKLIKHINNIWSNIQSWWYDPKIQENIKRFNMELNVPFKNFDKLESILRKELE